MLTNVITYSRVASLFVQTIFMASMQHAENIKVAEHLFAQNNICCESVINSSAQCTQLNATVVVGDWRPERDRLILRRMTCNKSSHNEH